MKPKFSLKFIRNNFLAGAVCIIPLWVTILLIRAMVNLLKGALSALPRTMRPGMYISFAGAEIVIALLLILLIGFLVNNIVGKKVVSTGETLLSKIPIVRTVYHGIKHLTTGIVGDKKIFSQAVLLEFPIKGLRFIGFITGEEKTLLENSTDRLLKIFIPTTPNPTSGFFCFVPEDKVEKLSISVEEAFKLIISAGYANLNAA